MTNKMFGEKNPQWKGDDVGYGALHEWVKARLPKPDKCEDCGKVEPYDLANKSDEYKRDLNDWEWLCRRCHMTKDGRMNNLDYDGEPWNKGKEWPEMQKEKHPLWKGGVSFKKTEYQREWARRNRQKKRQNKVEGVKCMECDAWFKALTNHVSARHGLKATEYYAKWDLPKGSMVGETVRKEISKTWFIGEEPEDD